MTTTPSQRCLLSTKDAADYLSVSPDTLTWWRCRGGGPAFLKLTKAKNGPVRYRREDLEAWLGQAYNSTAHFKQEAA